MKFPELFTESVQQVRPLAHSKGLVSFFDYRGPNVDFAIDGNLMRLAMYRLPLTLTASIEQGDPAFSAEAACYDTGRWLGTVTTAGTVPFAPDDTLVLVLQRHGVVTSTWPGRTCACSGRSRWQRSRPSTWRLACTWFGAKGWQSHGKPCCPPDR